MSWHKRSFVVIAQARCHDNPFDSCQQLAVYVRWTYTHCYQSLSV